MQAYILESIAQKHRDRVILNPQKGISHSILIHRNASLAVAREEIVHPNGRKNSPHRSNPCPRKRVVDLTIDQTTNGYP